MTAAIQAKANKTLDVKINYDKLGIMTRRQWIDLQKKNGATVEKSTKNRIDFDRIKHFRMNLEESIEYEKKCEEQVICYKLHPDWTYYYEITKAEYDYFLSL